MPCEAMPNAYEGAACAFGEDGACNNTVPATDPSGGTPRSTVVPAGDAPDGLPPDAVAAYLLTDCKAGAMVGNGGCQLGNWALPKVRAGPATGNCPLPVLAGPGLARGLC